MTVTPESWTVIDTGIVILVAIAASNRQIRGEMNGLHAEIGRLRERMGKLEGLLEGLREAVAGRKAA
jgi:prefoldin subunit 5